MKTGVWEKLGKRGVKGGKTWKKGGGASKLL